MKRNMVSLLVGSFLLLNATAQVTFRVHLDSSIHREITGRLYVYTTSDTVKGVPDEPDYKQPMFALDVENWGNSRVIEIDDRAAAFSLKPSAMKPGYYKAVALVDGDPGTRGAFNPGSVYSRNVLFQVKENDGSVVDIYLNRQVRERPFKESDSLKLLSLKSELLSGFHHKDVYIKAGVILPKEYNDSPQKTYPVVYVIPGWGGTHYDAMDQNRKKRYGMNMGLPKIYVYLNPETQTRWGLHAFVDSKVNGPWGKALVEEVIPFIRKNYRAAADPSRTFVIGQSSGGYPSLWLLLHYPKAFGGGWAVSPDPVDFSAFSGVDLYAKNANFYLDENGNERGFFLKDGKFLSTLRGVTKEEIFQGDGGQQQSFEAEFGSLDKNGKPRLLFDRATGKINRIVVEEWKLYDMAIFIEKNWSRLAKDLAGKIHVFAGAEDNFLLNRAVEAFKKKSGKLGADMTIEIIPGANHFTVWSSPGFIERMHNEMDEKVAGK